MLHDLEDRGYFLRDRSGRIMWPFSCSIDGMRTAESILGRPEDVPGLEHVAMRHRRLRAKGDEEVKSRSTGGRG